MFKVILVLLVNFLTITTVLANENYYSPKQSADQNLSDIANLEQKTLIISELVIIDSGISDSASLLQYIPPNIPIISIENNLDGLSQLSSALKRYSGIKTLHVISHASDGLLQLGNGKIGIDQIDKNSELFTLINNSLVNHGDILFYGCNLAAGPMGQKLLSYLKDNTHSDIAASENKTGNLSNHADWDLEFHLGDINSQSLFNNLAVSGFNRVLAITDGAGDNIDFANFNQASLVTTTTYSNVNSSGFDLVVTALGSPLNTTNGELKNDLSGHLYVDSEGETDIDAIEIYFSGGQVFDVNSIRLKNLQGVTRKFQITSDLGNIVITEDLPNSTAVIVDLTSFTGVSRLTITNYTAILPAPKMGQLWIDDLIVSNTMDGGPDITSATFDASTGELIVSGTGFEANSGALNDVSANKFTFTGEAGGTYTLTNTPDVEISSDTEFTLSLSNDDELAVNALLNQNGTSAISGTTYNLAAAAGFIANVTGASDLTGNTITVSNAPIAEGSLIAATGITEPINLPTTSDSVGEAVDVFDFTLTDSGADGYPLVVSNITINLSGTSTDAERDQVTWRLNGPDASDIAGAYSAGSNTISFSSLSLSIADGGSETYTVNAYFNSSAGIADNRTWIFSVDGDNDVSLGAGSRMGATSAITNGVGGQFIVTATNLAFTTQPAGSVSGTNLTTQPVIAAQDAFGNTDTDFIETITLTEASAGTLTGNTASAVAGVATFTALNYSATADQQSFTLTANDQDNVDSNLPTTNSNAVTADVVATQLTYSIQPAPLSLASGQSTSFTTMPVVTAVDGNSIVDTGYSAAITLSIVNGAGSATMTGTGDTDGSAATVTLTPTMGAVTFTGLQVTYTASGASNETFNLQASSGGLTTANSGQITAITLPTVTDGNINISGASGSGGTYKIGDTVTATWNNTAGGDNNIGITGVTVNFSAFGGGATVVASESSGSWTATYTITAGAISSANLNVTVTATNGSGATTTADSSNADVDNTAPVLSEVTAATTPTKDNTPNLTINTTKAGTLSINGSCGSASEGAISSGNTTIVLSQTDNSSALTDSTYSNCTASLTDNTGNTSNTLPITTFTVDTTAPTVSLSATAGPVNTAFTTTITFSEDVTGFAVGDIAASNANLSNFSATSASVYTVTVTPISDGSVTLDIAANSAIDSASNGNTVASQLSVLFDSTAPTVAPSATAGPVNTAFTTTITFSEDVTGFVVGDIAASNANLSNFSATSASVYTVTVTPISDGSVTLDIAANSAIDSASNGNTVASQLSVLFDSTAPTVSLSATAGPVNAAFTTTITFSEDVTGFVVGDIAASNANLSNFSATSASVYTVTVTPISDGSVTLDIAANSAIDSASNGNTVASQLGVLFDSTAPTVSLSATAGPVNTAFTATITFSEDVTGFVVGDIAASNANLSNFSATSASVYTVTVTPISDGSVTLDIAANSAIDSASNGNTVASQLSVLFDSTAPTVSLSATAGPVNAAFTTTITFSEDVTGFAVGDIAASNANLSNFSATSASVYTVTVTPISDGSVTLDIAANSAIDSASNGNTVASQLSVLFDSTAPTVSLSATAGPVNAAFTTTITFSEDVTGFVVGDIAASNANLSNFSATSASVYTVTVTPISDGSVTLDIAANSAIDSASNGNTVASQLSVLFDSTAPTVALSATVGPVNTAFTATITFSEDVTGFVVGDIAASNANLSNFSATSASVYTVTVTPISDGSVTLDIGANSAIDSASNGNTVASQLGVLFDSTAPTVSLSATAGPVNTAFTTTITFSEDVTGFVVGDIAASNANLSNFSATSASVYTVTVTPISDGSVTLDIAANSAIDSASNGNTVASQLSVLFDSTAPTVALSATAGPVNAVFTTTITFSEDVTGFAVGDIAASNANLSNFSATSASVYTVTVTPISDGSVTLDIAANSAIDSASNGNTVASQLSVLFDSTAPTVALSATAGPVNAVFTTTITFSEDVTGFAVGDIAASNANLSNFIATSASVYTVTVTPISDGSVTLDIAANSAIDSTGNNTAAAGLSIIYDATAPTLTLSNPADNALATNRNTDITLAFSEDINAISSGGNLSLMRTSDDLLIGQWPIDGAAVSVSGAEVTLITGLNLTPTATYYLLIDAGAIADNAGNDFAGITSSSTLKFTIDNSAPVATNDIASTNEDNSIAINVLANDSDSDSNLNAASTSIISAPVNGGTSINTANGVITYTPNVNFNGMDNFTYSVADEYGKVSNGGLVTVTITSVNDAPLAVNDMASTLEDNAISIDIAANDSDIDAGDSVSAATLVVVTGANNGTAVVNNGEVVYTPNFNFNGSDSFSYTIEDQNGATSNPATVTVNVSGVNDSPTANADAATTDEDTSIAIDVLDNDSDLDGSLNATSVSVMASPANGSVSIDALTGEITYTPTANYNGSDSFTYIVQDDVGATSNVTTVTLTINSINDAPIVNADTAVVAEDIPYIINVLGNDVDLDGSLDLTSINVVSPPTQGTATANNNGTITYAPANNFAGNDGFTYTVKDNAGAVSATAAVTLTVSPVNDAPLANNDNAITDENTEVSIDIAANDSDSDGFIDFASFTLVSPPSLGKVANLNNGTISYTPNTNTNGNDSFSYTFTDNLGVSTNVAYVTIRINPVNDAPTITGTPATSINEDEPYRFNPIGADIDNTDLTYSASGLPSWLSINAATGALTGTPINDDVGTSSTIVITVSDGELSTALAGFTVTVLNTNDAPAISGTPANSVDEDGSYRFTPNSSDIDTGDNLSYTANNLPSWAAIDPTTGAVTGTPSNDDVGVYRDIVITVNDGTTSTDLAAFSITVANTNDAPIANSDSYSTNEGALLQVTANQGVLANDLDIDTDDTLTAVLVDTPKRASNFTLNNDGSFSYRHNGSETRTDSFTYALSDGTVTLPATTVNLAIMAVNDPPAFTSTPKQTTYQPGDLIRYSPIISDPDSVVDTELLSGPSWLSFDGSTLMGQVPIDADPGIIEVTLTTSDQAFGVEQILDFTITERASTIVSIAADWQGLPALAGKTLTLTNTLTHTAGPAITRGELYVSLQGVDFTANLAGCTATTSAQWICPFSLAAGATSTQKLTLTRASEGNIVVNIRAVDALTNTQVAATITDVSVTDIAVGQGNSRFNLADATSLASIDLDGEGSRELVAGTGLGGNVQLLRYGLSTGSASTIGTIANTGNTREIKVGDINGDGLDDVVVVNDNGDATNVYYQMGDISFSTEAATRVLPYAKRGLLVDLDNDKLPELMLGGRGNRLYIYPNIGGVFSAEPYLFDSIHEIVHFALRKRAANAAPYSGTLAVSTRDAIRLLRFTRVAVASQKIHRQKTGSEAQSDYILDVSEVDSLAISGVTEIISQDLDNDGEEELVASTGHNNNSAELSGVTIARVENDTFVDNIQIGNASAKNVSLADFNGDGAIDVLVANDNDSYQFYYGNGTVNGWTLKDTIIFNPSTLVLPEDVDNDGLADVLIYEDTTDEVNLYLTAADGNLGQTANIGLNAIAKAVSNQKFQWQYVVTITNPSSQAIGNVTLAITLPEGTIIASKPSACVETPAGLTCMVASLAANTSEPFSVVLTANSKPNGSATAVVTSNALDSDISNNTASTPFAPLFITAEVHVEGGGNSGGSFGGIFSWLLAIVFAARALYPRILLALIGLTPFSTHAKERLWFMELGLGNVNSHWNASSLKASAAENAQTVTVVNIDDKRSSQEILVGYRQSPFLAIEAGYRDWGNISYQLQGIASDPNALLNTSQSYFPASGKGGFTNLRASFWQGDNLEGYAKVGAWRWSGEYTTDINGKTTNLTIKNTNVTFSVGMNGYFLEHYYLGAMYQTANLFGQRNVMVGVKIGARF